MTEDERRLQELKRLAKEANKRINALERFAGYRTAFAVKQLFDYIENNKVQGVGTKVRKVRSDEYLTSSQQIAIIKAVKDFLKDEASTIKGAREIVKSFSKKAKKPITPRGASIMYQMWRGWQYYEEKYNLGSDFWQEIAPLAREKTQKQWIDIFEQYISVEVDITFKKDAEQIYKHLKE